ncbi:hypothetical protein HMPREF1550_01581 [Actinomyces sp. oral taxon 877 str. F0543]|nr:hypothetical protein HMPREF1550_01581 [Actinomyces sp. oral taxon 877 str. F0543]
MLLPRQSGHVSSECPFLPVDYTRPSRAAPPAPLGDGGAGRTGTRRRTRERIHAAANPNRMS